MGDLGQEPVAGRGEREWAEVDARPVGGDEPADRDGVRAVAGGDGLGEGGGGVEDPETLALVVVGDEDEARIGGEKVESFINGRRSHAGDNAAGEIVDVAAATAGDVGGQAGDEVPGDGVGERGAQT